MTLTITRIDMKVIAAIAMAALLSVSLLPLAAQAAHSSTPNFTEAGVRLDRMKTSEVDNDYLIVATPASVGTEAKMKVTFPAGFDVDATAANITVTTTGIPADFQGDALTAWPGIGAAASAVSGQVVTVASSDLTVGTQYGFFITAGVDNSASAGEHEFLLDSTDSGDVEINHFEVATRLISDDRVVISAKVDSRFNWTLSGNTDDLGELTAEAINSGSGITGTVKTNSKNGYIIWAKSDNTSLDSANTGETIETVGTINDATDTLVAGTNGYVLDVDLTTDSATGDSTLVIDSEYNGADTSSGGTLSATFEEAARGDGTTNGDVVTFIVRAAVDEVTAAADDYTDTLTLVAAGNY